MQSTTVLQSRTGNDSISISADLTSHFVTIHVAHVDDFDGDDDYWVTVGEFRVADIIEALLPPVPASRAARQSNPTIRRIWRRKRVS